MKPKLFVISSLYYKPRIGGVENSLFYLASSIIKIKKEAVIFVSNKGNDLSINLPHIDKDGEISVERFNLPKIHKILFFLGPLIFLYNTYIGFIKFKKRNIDRNIIIISRNHIVTLAAHFVGFKKIVYIIPSTIKGLADQKNTSLPFIKKIFEFITHLLIIPQHHYIQKHAIKISSLNIVFSQNMQNQVGYLFGGRKFIKPMIIAPGVDFEKFCFDIQKKNIIRKKYKLSNEFIFLCLGRIDKNKGFADVLNAFSLLPENLKRRSKIIIVGTGPELINLISLSKKLDISSKIIFIGASNTPEEFYSISDCFMMTSRYEAFGQTIIEAMASGLPIIAYKIDKIRIKTATNELIENNINGFYCNFNINSLAICMENILTYSTDKLEIMRNRNINLVKKKFSWDNFLNEILNKIE